MVKQAVPWKIQDIIGIFMVVLLVNQIFSWIYSLGVVSSEFFLNVFATIVQAMVFAGLVIYFVRIRYRLSWSALGLGRVPFWRTLKVGLLSGLLLYFLVILMMYLMLWVYPQEPGVQSFVQMLESAPNWGYIAAIILMGSLFAPISEELFFRGFLYPYFRDRWGIFWGLLVSGLIFGSMHLDLFRLLPLSLGGVGLAWIYQRTGSLYSSMIAHSVWNSIMTLLLLWSM